MFDKSSLACRMYEVGDPDDVNKLSTNSDGKVWWYFTIDRRWIERVKRRDPLIHGHGDGVVATKVRLGFGAVMTKQTTSQS